MPNSTWSKWGLLVAANAVILCVLGFYRTSSAAPPRGEEPFANAVQQRFEMIEQLRLVNSQLKEQNDLLRSGKLRIVVNQP